MPVRHSRESGDPSGLGPRFRGDDEVDDFSHSENALEHFQPYWKPCASRSGAILQDGYRAGKPAIDRAAQGRASDVNGHRRVPPQPGPC
jgi:hypothetical protein